MNIRTRETLEMGAGGILFATGLALMLGLPPNWWPSMGSYFVHVGVLSGVTLSVLGFSLFVVGACRLIDSPKAAALIKLWERAIMIGKFRFVFLVPLVAILAGPLLWPSEENAQVPSNSGICSNSINGNNNYQSNKCYNIDPPELPNHVYQNKESIGRINGISPVLPNGTVQLLHPDLSLENFNPSLPMKVGTLSLMCPDLIAAYHPGASHQQWSLMGTMSCVVVR